MATNRTPTSKSKGDTVVYIGSPIVSGSSLDSLQRIASGSKTRLNVGDRLKKLSKDIGKLRKSSKKASPKAAPAEVETEAVDIPPTPVSNPPVHAKLLSVVPESEEPEPEIETTAEPPEATNLAERIQSLVDSLPFPTLGSKKTPVSKPPARDADGRPIPPPTSTPIKDSRLLSFLSSPTIMNGSRIKGIPSIWSVLEGIGKPAHGFPPTQEDNKDNQTTPDEASSPSENDDEMFSDTSSVMIYSPLIPGTEDLPELAELVTVGAEEEIVSTPVIQNENIPNTPWTTMWPLSMWYSPETQSSNPNPSSSTPNTPSSPQPRPRRLSGDTVISPVRTSVDSAGRVVRTQTVRAWVPSTTKLSVQAMWWGYRLYLPPPVLAILSDKTLEATKRAAMLTTALTWFFNNLPVSSLPPALRPAALLLQRLAPFLGYIGTFISWSWSTIKGYDIGYGVILTATWLLPIALIPGTWHQNEFPISPTQAASVPLPPMSPLPSYDMEPLPSMSSPVGSAVPLPSFDNTPTPRQETVSLPRSTVTSPRNIPLPLSPVPTSPKGLPSTPLPPTSPRIPSSPLPPASPRIPTSPLPTPAQSSASVLSSPSAYASALSSPPSPAPSSPRTSSSPRTPTPRSARRIVSIPVPPTPRDVPPVPPKPSPRPLSPEPVQVPLGSPLSHQLLSGPVMGTVPLPDEDAPVPVYEVDGAKQKKRGLFSRTSSKRS